MTPKEVFKMKDRRQLWQAVKFTLFSASAGVIQVGAFAVLEFLFCKFVVYRGQEDTLKT